MLTVTPTVVMATSAPGPYVEIVVSGIGLPGSITNLVPDPSITSDTIWGTVIGGTYSGIDPPTIPAAWARSTAAFATTPAALRALVTGTGASGKIYLCPWTAANPGNHVEITGSARVTVTDSVRLPRITVVSKDAANVETVVGSISWPTATNASFTTQTNTVVLPSDAVSFRAYAELSGTPTASMTVYFDDLSVAVKQLANTIAVTRQWEGKDAFVQNGMDVEVVGTSMLFYDYAVPFGVSVQYTAVTSDNGVVEDSGQSSIVQVNETGVWISDSISPELAIKVIPDRKSFRTKSLTREGGPVRLIGRKEPIAVVGSRQAASNIPFAVVCYTNLQTFTLESFLIATDPFLLRSSAEHNLPSLAYLTASEITIEYLDAPEGETSRVSMVVDIVASPALDVLVPIRTYGNLPAEMTDYNSNPYVDYLSMLRGS